MPPPRREAHKRDDNVEDIGVHHAALEAFQQVAGVHYPFEKRGVELAAHHIRSADGEARLLGEIALVDLRLGLLARLPNG